jgi:CBS domain containing-hemolysin-like protein
MLATRRTFTEKRRAIIAGAFGIAERHLHEVVLPRPDVVTLDAAIGIVHLRALISASGTGARTADRSTGPA